MFPNINKTKNPQRPTLAPNIARGAQTGSGGLTLTKFEVSKGRGPVTPTGPSYGMAATNFPSSSSSSGSTLLRRAKGKDERDVPRQRPNTPMPDNPVASAAAGGVVAHAAADPSGAPRGKEKAKRGRTTYKVTREDKDEPKHFEAKIGWRVPDNHKGPLQLVVTRSDSAARTETTQIFEISKKHAHKGKKHPIKIRLDQNVTCRIQTPDGAQQSAGKEVRVASDQPLDPMGGNIRKYLKPRHIYPNYALSGMQKLSDKLYEANAAKLSVRFAQLHLWLLEASGLKDSDEDGLSKQLERIALEALADMGFDESKREAISNILPIIKQVKSAGLGTYNLIKAGTTRYASYKLRSHGDNLDKFYVYYPRPKTAHAAFNGLANYRQSESRKRLLKACEHYAKLCVDTFVPGSTILDTGFTLIDFLYEYNVRVLDALEVEATNTWLDDIKKTQSPNSYYAVVTYGHVTVPCGVVMNYKPGAIIRAAQFADGMREELKELEVAESELRAEAASILLDQRFALHGIGYAPPTKEIAVHRREKLEAWAKREKNRERDRDYRRYIEDKAIETDKKAKKDNEKAQKT